MRQNLIYDVGLHLGEDTEFYLKKGFSVVAVEANPVVATTTADRLKAYVDSGQLTIVNKAIARDEGPITFFVSDLSIWSTTDPNVAQRNARLGSVTREITVPGISFDRLLEEYGVPYYLKIDIEGADILCLEGLLASADRPQYVSLESSKTSFENLVHEFCLLQNLGYRKYKIVAQHRIGEQRLPSPAREGQHIEHAFQEGSSGAFGRELPGEWMPLEQALKEYMRIFKRYRVFGDDGSVSSFMRTATNPQGGRPIASAAVFARRMLSSSRFLRSIKAKIRRPFWYDTHAMLGD